MIYLLMPINHVTYTQTHTHTHIYIFFFFFFYWRYNPLWFLAFSVIFFHSALSSHCFLHRLTLIICKSSSMPAIHLFLGLPLILVPIGFHCNILLSVLLSSIRITWPSHAILLYIYVGVHFSQTICLVCATYCINWLVFITAVKSVYSAVRTDSLHRADYV